MNIMHVTIRYYPALGGVEEYVRRLAEGSFARGKNVSVYTSDLDCHTGKLSKIIGMPSVYNGIIIRRAYTIPWKLRDYPLIPGMGLLLMRQKADIIHGHCFMSFPSDAARVISRVRKIPFVFNPYFAAIGESSRIGCFYRKTLGRFVMSADVVVVISEFEKHAIERACFSVKRFEVVPPGIDTSEFRNINHNVYERFPIKGRRIILFVGRIDRNKGIDILIKAAPHVLRRNPDTVFFIAGADFGERANLQKMVGEYKLNESFIFAGSLARQDIVSAFKHADVFALPSRYEAFGIVLIEAMAARLPVIAADTTAIPEVVSDGLTGLLFPTDDSQALAIKLCELLDNNGLRQQFKDNGYKKVSQEYTWEQTFKRIHAVYESVAA